MKRHSNSTISRFIVSILTIMLIACTVFNGVIVQCIEGSNHRAIEVANHTTKQVKKECHNLVTAKSDSCCCDSENEPHDDCVDQNLLEDFLRPTNDEVNLSDCASTLTPFYFVSIWEQSNDLYKSRPSLYQRPPPLARRAINDIMTFRLLI